MDYMKPESVQEGVRYLPDKNLDVFLVTLNKSDKDYSPTGQRYIYHKQRGSQILLFVREFKKDIAGAAPYTFLGLVDYRKHEGSRAISFVWKLHKPIPAKFLKKANKLVVG